MRSILFTLLLTATAALGQPAAHADDDWTLRLLGVWVDPSLSTTVENDDGTPIAIGTDSDIGLGVDLGYRLRPRVGLELSVVSASPDLGLAADLSDSVRIEVAEAVRVTPVTLGVAIDLLQDAPVRWSVTPMVGWAFIDDPTFRFDEADDELRLSIDDTFTWGAATAVGIPIGDSAWSAHVGLRYLGIELDVVDLDDADSNPGHFDYDPFIGTVGVAYRF